MVVDWVGDAEDWTLFVEFWPTELSSGGLVFSDGSNLTVDSQLIWDDTNKRLGLGVLAPTYKLDVKGLTAASAIRSDIGFDVYPVPDPTGLAGELSAGTELEIGRYYYYVTFVTGLGQTAKSNLLTMNTTAGNQRVLLTVPVSTDPRVTGRQLWRSKVGGAYYGCYNLFLIENNTDTTYLDVIPDTSLVSTFGYGTYNSTSYYLSKAGVPSLVIDENLVSLGATGLPFIGAWNTLIGFLAGGNMTNLNTTGNTLIGYRAGGGIVGSGNTLIGYSSGYTSASNNVCVGFQAGAGGTSNIAIGRQALFGTGSGATYNVGVGQYAGMAITTGDYNTFLGTRAGLSSLATAQNSMALGYLADVTASNQVVIGNDSVTATLLKGDVSTAGDVSGGTLTAGDGASGSFTTVDGKTVTVVNGIITSIV
ncbi:MAG: hypothetical protein ABIJ18_05760 [archaeon]